MLQSLSRESVLVAACLRSLLHRRLRARGDLKGLQMFKCIPFLEATHQWGWPRNGQQTCALCGKQRPAKVDLTPSHSTAVVPRWEGKAQERETEWEWKS